VTVESAGAVVKAVLRIGIHSGLEIASPLDKFSAGVEVGVFANVAEFVTNVTAAPDGDSSGCELRIMQSYQLALGAAAGASVAVGTQRWGPTPETQIPIWYTTLADVCAIQGRSTAAATSTTAAVTARAEAGEGDLIVTTITTEVIYTAVACKSTGLVDCPASLQATSKFTTTKTSVTAAPSGSEAMFPTTARRTVVSTIAFGSNAKALIPTTGSPVSYVPPPSSTSSHGANGIVGTAARDAKKIIIGVTIGVGVPVLAAIIAGCL
jgi:hypothetical protein